MGQLSLSCLWCLLLTFSERGYRDEDLNWDGIVDDADLLQVPFQFGSGCYTNRAGKVHNCMRARRSRSQPASRWERGRPARNKRTRSPVFCELWFGDWY